jgi:hypothetical protein
MERERRKEPYDTGFRYRPKRRRGRSSGSSAEKSPLRNPPVILAGRYSGDTPHGIRLRRAQRSLVSFRRSTSPPDGSIESGLQFREDGTPWCGRAQMYAAQLRHESFPHRFPTLFQKLCAD